MITGAAGGIGSAFTIALARPGANLYLVDTDRQALEAVADRARAAGADVSCHGISVTDDEALASIAGRLDQPLTHLVTCAGVMHIGSVRASTLGQARRVIDTNLWGTMATVGAFLGHLHTSVDAHLIAVSSGLGLMALPDYSAYAASKYGIRGFIEALAQERAEAHLTVTTVYPGCVRTPIIHRATTAPDIDLPDRERTFDRLATTTPTDVATRALDAAHSGRSRAVIGTDARAGDIAARLLPGTYRYVTEFLARHGTSWKR